MDISNYMLFVQIYRLYSNKNNGSKGFGFGCLVYLIWQYNVLKLNFSRRNNLYRNVHGSRWTTGNRTGYWNDRNRTWYRNNRNRNGYWNDWNRTRYGNY
jgi:hypothetical protein